MDLIAERGVAAHWTYKFGGDSPNSAQSRAHAWIVELIDSQRAAGSSLEFLDNVKVDLFPDEVYLFTPKGKILALPRNSTALDFAYAVHTDVGNMAVASRVDKKLVPLRTKLVSGQSVEIITARSATPKPQWLEFVVTSKARTAIRHQLKQLEHEDAVQLGHRMLDRALEAMDSSLERLPKGRLDAFLAEHRFPRLEALLAEVALGNWMPTQAAQALMAYAELRGGPHSRHHSQEKILINGSERGVVTFAGCCQPIPGDEIMGYHTAGKGIVVHRMDCPNLAELRKSPERWVPIGWDTTVSGDYDTSLVVEVENGTGVLAQLAAAIAQSHSNIERVDYLDRDFNAAVLAFNILGIVVVYGLQRLQGMLPLNPAGMGAVTPDSALNTAISFVANTNWQGYGGESTMSYLTQMLALTVQNFVSAATGIAVLFALIRGLARHCSATVGNFWADMVRCTLRWKPCITTSRAWTPRASRSWMPRASP
ncbi:hypothetical protein G6F31_013630 [Rhizopus arrhizus]|nr:hypothetical protein G6F31_013630 [Rhizopus arrhizus]